MAKTSQIIALLEDFAPLNTAQSWDNSGWQINLGIDDVKKIMTVLTVTEDVVSQAIKEGCDFILSHHPLFFEPIKKIEDKFISEAIKNNIQIYSSHTNLDVANGGTSDILAKMAGFTKVEVVNDFLRSYTFNKEIRLEDFVYKLKNDLSLENIKLINNKNLGMVKTVAFCAGSGGSFISLIKNSKIDIYITGDVKYHEAIDAESLIVLDIGHFESEKYVTDIFKHILRKINVEIVTADEKNIWQIV